MNQPSGNDNALHDQAFELIRGSHDRPGPEAGARLARWAARSPRHRAALERARAEWALLGEARMDDLGTAGRARLFFEQRVAMARDHPGRTAAFAAVVLCVLLLLPLTAPVDDTDAPQTIVSSVSSTAPTSREYETPYGGQATCTLPDNRSPDSMKLPEDAGLTPIPVEEGALSLSGILLEDDYYEALQDAKREIDGVSIIDETLLIPFKARAFEVPMSRDEAIALLRSAYRL